MLQKFAQLPLHQKLAVIALILGVIALFAGDPRNSANTTLDAKELALIVEKKVDHITVDALSDWIIKGKADYRLIDLNEEKEFAEYHIPGASNISLAALDNGDLTRNEKIVLYSNGGIHAAQGWMFLKAKRYTSVYTLLGGLEEWKEKILFPVIPDSVSGAEKEKFSAIVERSKYFGGAPQKLTGGQQTAAMPLSTPSMPKISAPSGGGAAPAAGGKKKKEGC